MLNGLQYWLVCILRIFAKLPFYKIIALLQSSASTGTVLNTTVSGYTVLYSTGTHSAEQSVLVSSCATGQCEIRLSLAGVNDTITRVTVQGENTFGRGEETQCNKHNISMSSIYCVCSYYNDLINARGGFNTQCIKSINIVELLHVSLHYSCIH